MIDLSYEKNSEIYFDFRKGLNFLRQIDDNDYEYPDEITNFHVYSEIKNDKELECIKSYFATQNLEKTKLILWSDYDITDNKLLQPFKDKIDFRVWDAASEAKGTILENEKEKLESADQKHYLQSDLLRLLALHKYGGVWIDMDIILLRDFKSILDQEYMYQWGGETNFEVEGACATVLSLKKQSEFSKKLLLMLKEMPIIGNTPIWGKDLFAKLYKLWPYFTIFPSTFFNTEWLISKVDRDFSKNVQKGWFDKTEYSDNLFLGAFAWHWHNSSNKSKKIQEGSKFNLLKKRNDKLLEERGFSLKALSKKDIQPFIFNWKNQFEKTCKIENELLKIFDSVIVINSDDNNTREGWINVGDEYYFSDQFREALNLFDDNKKVLLHIQGDVTYNNWSGLVDSAIEYFDHYEWGIFAPDIDWVWYTSENADINGIESSHENIKMIANADETVWFIHSDIIRYFFDRNLMECFNENTMGWGWDLVFSSLCFINGRAVIRDYNHVIDHPVGTNYNSQLAMSQWQNTMLKLDSDIVECIRYIKGNRENLCRYFLL
jgi:hypothetical protein